MQTKTLQGILSLISHTARGDDDPIMPPCPGDVDCFAVAHGNMSLQSVGEINYLIMLYFPPYLLHFPVVSPFIQC